jgi:hypothetical protein
VNIRWVAYPVGMMKQNSLAPGMPIESKRPDFTADIIISSDQIQSSINKVGRMKYLFVNKYWQKQRSIKCGYRKIYNKYISALLIYIFAFVAIALPGATKAQENRNSTSLIIQSCRDLARDPRPSRNGEMQGFCAGVIEGLVWADSAVCAPQGSPVEAAYRAVVRYIDARPARHSESFKRLASEALRSSWPCR